MKEIGIQDRQETPKPLESLGHASVRCGVVCYYCWLALLDLLYSVVQFFTLILRFFPFDDCKFYPFHTYIAVLRIPVDLASRLRT